MIKEKTRLFLTVLALIAFSLVVNAQENIATETNKEVIVSQKETMTKAQKEAKNLIEEIYGEENSKEIYENFIAQVEKAIKERPKELIEQDKKRLFDWYKNEIIYMFYVDQFGVVSDEKKNTFKDTTLMLDYLEDLGVNIIYASFC